MPCIRSLSQLSAALYPPRYPPKTHVVLISAQSESCDVSVTYHGTYQWSRANGTMVPWYVPWSIPTYVRTRVPVVPNGSTSGMVPLVHTCASVLRTITSTCLVHTLCTCLPRYTCTQSTMVASCACVHVYLANYPNNNCHRYD